MKYTIPKVLRQIDEATDDRAVIRLYNRMMCMFISPMLLVGIAAYALFHLFAGRFTAWVGMDITSFLILTALFELLLRVDAPAGPGTHMVSALYSAMFLYCLFRFYPVMGYTLWTFGFVLILLAMSHISRTMLAYIGFTLLASGIYATLVPDAGTPEITVGMQVLEFAFFGMIILVSTAIHSIGSRRYGRVKAQRDELIQEVAERRRAEERNLQLALYDQLSGLPNRTQFYDRLHEAIDCAGRRGAQLYVAFVDLDYFKLVNDTMGHNTGDELLRQVAARLSGIFRAGDFIARIGGDEFLVLVQDEEAVRNIDAVISRLLIQVSRPFRVGGREITVTCSAGVAKFPDDGTDVETLIQHADLAMYKAKDDGKNRLAYYSADLKKVVQFEMDMIEDLQLAVERGEFELYYQPQIDTGTKAVAGMEALLRWNHPKLGLVYPDSFIAVAEKSGLIVPIGDWVLKTACTQNKAWQERGAPAVPVAVNISVSQVKSRKLAESVARVLGETGLAPRYLELEITERVLVKDMQRMRREIERLKELGVKLAIDDFGTGYSSINYLRELPVDCIKIPMDFTAGVGKNAKDESIITVILALAQSLNINVVAEGVETKGQLDFLTDRYCTHIQGYYFSRPKPARDIEEYIAGWHGGMKQYGQNR